ncbi:hypothetical protein HYH02_008105 [Chlamydomonas schloesseri]|uniref:Uncharacterized protein n=1 Tax=Chlamydomonas schloesseri TaxID=2026947 RepID=A0A835WGF1_9CHLO|nr:hypothetical protein HYH02_008105 [Chlamydomonas schloesseri]|eukprot:KAG2446951.1 hypothetical protein HYH02_008105 [Chlamydomonas schloesseri]
MAPSPSRQAGAGGSGISDGHSRAQSGVTRGALSGVMGASPFGVLATTPELPTSTLVLGATSPRPLLPSTESAARRPGQAGLSLRRANSNSASGGNARTSASGAHVGATGRRGGLLTMKRIGLALVLLQLALGWLVYVYRPAWLAGVTGLVRAAPAAASSHGAATATATGTALHGGNSGGATTTSAKAAGRTATTHVASLAGSRKERAGTTLGELAQRAGISIETPAVTAATTGAAAATTTTKAKASHHNSRSGQQSVRLQSTPAAAVDAKKHEAAAAAKTSAAAAAIAAAAAAKTAVVATSLKNTKAAAYPPFTVPVVPYANRVASPPRITGVVFYGRRSRVRILDCYLQRNMARNGGLLSEVVFVRATWEGSDVAFLEKLVALRAPDYRTLMPQRLDVGYTGHYAWMDPAQIYVKIDDDVVFIADHAVDHMLAAHMLNRWHLISANVVNHQPLELPHSQRGAHTLYEQMVTGDKSSWRPVMRTRKVTTAASGAGGNVTREVQEPVPFIDNGWDVWGDWKKAASVHYSFLANHAANKLGLYEFPHNEKLWDFNAHIGYTRWRINMIMFKGAAIDVHVYNMSSTTGTYPGDDEDYITRILPQQLNATSAAVSPALAVHFSFYMQRGGLENSTDLLDRYALLAERTCGRLLPPE